MSVKLTVTPEKHRKEKFCWESVMVHWIWPPNQTPFLLYLSSSHAGFHWAGKQSIRHVSFSTESPGAGKWGCCHPVGFECFITAYTEEQLPTARSLTSGQQCRRSRRGLHCPATTPASTRTQAVCAGMKDDLERTELLGMRATSLLIIQKLLTMVCSSGPQKLLNFTVLLSPETREKDNLHFRCFTIVFSCRGSFRV